MDNEYLLVKVRFKFIGVMSSVEWKNRCTRKSQNLQSQMFCNRYLLQDECEFIFSSTKPDLRGGRNLDRRIIPAIFQSQRRSGNDRQDHEGRSRIRLRHWVSRAIKQCYHHQSDHLVMEPTPILCKKTV